MIATVIPAYNEPADRIAVTVTSALAVSDLVVVVDDGGRDVLDAVGRVATRAAWLLQGKHKATYTPFIDTGDHVVILNVAKVKLTGRKEEQKVYQQIGRAHV